MRPRYGLILASLIAASAHAQGEITVPWPEFQALYRQQLSSELAPEAPTPVGVLHHLETVLALSSQGAVARIRLDGQVLGEKPTPLRLFDDDLAVLAVDGVSGGTLAADEAGISFHPDTTEPFEIALTAALPVSRDRRSALLNVAMPTALRHDLSVTTSDELQVLEAPGIPAGEGRYALRPGEALSLRFSRVRADSVPVSRDLPEVATPALVLEHIDFSTSFSDNGNALSTLRLKLPAEAGRQLRLRAIADAEVWSVTVNDEPVRLLQEDQHWVIPLPGEAAQVLLSFLRASERLGLEGRLEFQIPALGLPAREARVTVGLAERLELVALEGDLEPDPERRWSPPPGFSGKPYRFRYPYYRGDALGAAIYYQEPIAEDAP